MRNSIKDNYTGEIFAKPLQMAIAGRPPVCNLWIERMQPQQLNRVVRLYSDTLPDDV
jgi:hypothetical protein